MLTRPVLQHLFHCAAPCREAQEWAKRLRSSTALPWQERRKLEAAYHAYASVSAPCCLAPEPSPWLQPQCNAAALYPHLAWPARVRCMQGAAERLRSLHAVHDWTSKYAPVH